MLGNRAPYRRAQIRTLCTWRRNSKHTSNPHETPSATCLSSLLLVHSLVSPSSRLLIQSPSQSPLSLTLSRSLSFSLSLSHSLTVSLSFSPPSASRVSLRRLAQAHQVLHPVNGHHARAGRCRPALRSHIRSLHAVARRPRPPLPNGPSFAFVTCTRIWDFLSLSLSPTHTLSLPPLSRRFLLLLLSLSPLLLLPFSPILSLSSLFSPPPPPPLSLLSLSPGGDWDLKTMLPLQLRLLQQQVPHCFKR